MRKWYSRVGMAVSAGVLLLAAFAGVAGAADGVVVAKGFNGPMGVLVAPDGTVYVIDSGLGGETQVTVKSPEDGSEIVAKIGDTARVVQVAPDGTQAVLAGLPSINFGQETSGGSRLALLNGTLYATGIGWTPEVGPEAPPLWGSVVKIEGGKATDAGKIWEVEKASNPDGTLVDSHPYGLTAGPDGNLWVADAGANTVFKVNPATGQVDVAVAFKTGVPSDMANPARGGAKEADPVPTGIAVGTDGTVYVAWLPGGANPALSKVVKLGADGSYTDYATGLAMTTDLRKGPDGNLYAVQLGQFTEQGPVPNSGSIVRVKPGATQEVVLSGLSFPTSIDFNSAGDAYVTTNGLGAPGSGELVKYAGLAATPVAAPAAPTTLPTTGGAPALLLPAILFAAAGIVAGVRLLRLA